VDNDININYQSIANYLKDKIISSPNYENNFTEDQRNIIDLTYAALEAGYNPNKVLSNYGLEKFNELFGINFNGIASISNLESTTVDVESTTVDVQEVKLNHKEIICSSFSLNKDVSNLYNYANPVPQTTCSHDLVANHICVIPNRQDRCPYYTPDFQHFATYTLAQNSKVYFNVYRHRATTGFTVYTIYDNDNNLVHNLSYDASTVYDHAKKDFNSELESIVIQAYSYILADAKFDCAYHNQSQQEVKVDNSNSYIATLVSIS